METTILLLEDDRLVLQMLALDLADAGFRVLEAETGEMAMRICSDVRPDIALLDMSLPDMSGLDFARWLTASLEVPFLFLSAYNDREIVANAAKLGALGYLVKPLDTQQILPTIQTALLRAKEIVELQKIEVDIKSAFKTNRTINIAIGLLMHRFGRSSDDTFDAFRTYCRNNRKKMIDVAKLIVEQGQQIDLTPFI